MPVGPKSNDGVRASFQNNRGENKGALTAWSRASHIQRNSNRLKDYKHCSIEFELRAEASHLCQHLLLHPHPPLSVIYIHLILIVCTLIAARQSRYTMSQLRCMFLHISHIGFTGNYLTDSGLCHVDVVLNMLRLTNLCLPDKYLRTLKGKQTKMPAVISNEMW